MFFKKLIMKLRLLALMLLLVILTGCAARPIILYPIRQTDFYTTGEGEEGEVRMSKWYFKNVLKIELDKGR